MAMEAVDLVVTALTAGAAAGAKDTASSAVKDAYAALVHAVRRRVTHEQVAVVDDPEDQQDALAAALTTARIDADQNIVTTAQALLARLDPDGAQTGKYTVRVKDSKGVQIGDHNTMNITF